MKHKAFWTQFGKFLSWWAVAGAALQSYALPGDLDPSFDPGSAINGVVEVIALQEDGRMLVGGHFTTVHGALRSGIARFNADGSVDEGFFDGMAGVVNEAGDLWVSAIAAQSDGKILLDGTFTSVNGSAQTNIARLNPDGSLDSSFRLGVGPADALGAIQVDPNGKIWLAGAWDCLGGENLVRLNSDGSRDTSFSAEGVRSWQHVDVFAVQSDGKVLVVGPSGSSTPGVELGTCLFARLNPDGTLDDAFAPSLSFGRTIRALAVQPDGRILVTGWFSNVNGVPRNCVARLHPDGSLDTTFLQGLAGTDGEVSTLALQSDGKILMGGWFSQVNGTERRFLARLNPDGTLDGSFLQRMSGPDALVFGLQIQRDAKILIRGSFRTVNGVGRPTLARLNSDGSTDPSFLSARSGPNNWVSGVAPQPDGKMYICGVFTTVDNLPRTNMARLNPDGSVDDWPALGLTTRIPTSFEPAVQCLACQKDGRVVLGGRFTAVNAASHGRIARLAADGSLDANFSPSIGGDYYGDNSQLTRIALQPDGKIIVGGMFTSVNTLARTNLARLNSDGSPDTSFLSPIGTSDYLTSLAVCPDGRLIVSGYSVPAGGALQKGLAQVQANGQLDPTFLSGLSGISTSDTVNAVAVQTDGKILVAGIITSVNGAPRHGLARINADGSLDDEFPDTLAGMAYGVTGIVLDQSGRILVSILAGGMRPTILLRLLADGTLDPAFQGVRTGPGGGATTVLPQDDGRILIAGSFTYVNGVPRAYLARLMGDYAAPYLITGPATQTAEFGTSVALPVRAGGSDLDYQWFFNGGAVEGATNPVLRRDDCDFSAVGEYTIVITNSIGAVTSMPAVLSVIAPVERRPVPAINLLGEAGSVLTLDYADEMSPTASWFPLATLSLDSRSEFYFDLSSPLPSQRAYRGRQTGPLTAPSSLGVHLIPAITLSGAVGDSLRLDYINVVGPTNAWVTLETVELTNSSQLYLDLSSIEHPRRLYRLVPSQATEYQFAR